MAADMAPDNPDPPSVWEGTAQKYASLRARAEDMMVRLASSEVESDLKAHLTRRWDVGADSSEPEPSDASLVAALTTFTSLLRLAATALPRPALARVYRRISAHLVNHIAQRAVYSGWSKFSVGGGRALAAEVRDWQAAARAALPQLGRDRAWSRLAEMATILSLPSGSAGGFDGDAGDTPTFAQAMAAAWGAPAALESLKARAGVSELDQEAMQAVLRRRVECWR